LLKSLAQQSWNDWELLILDNASTDGTHGLVLDFGKQLSEGQRIHWDSQRDTGIYDAWNRGLKHATGEYLCFIGADDTFVDANSLWQIAALTATQPHLITGRNAYFSKDGLFLRYWGSTWQWKRMRQSMNIAHPGMLIRRSLIQDIGLFDTSFRICGDYEWLLRLPSNISTIHTSKPILNIIQGGISHTAIGQVFAETFRAQRRHIGALPSTGCLALNWLKYLRRRFIGLA
jgi:glycosyltransferase involved in cell wall biosynthesis